MYIQIFFLQNSSGNNYFQLNIKSFMCAGQLFHIAKELYNTDLSIRVLESSNNIPGSRNVMVKFRIDFDNRQYVSFNFFSNSNVHNTFIRN